MFRKTFAAAVASAVGLTLLGAAPAQAADTVTIKKISTKTAPYKKSVKVKPSVTSSGKVKISKQTLTIKKGKKTVAKNKTSAKLKAGSYKVTTTVKYRAYKNVTKNVVRIKKGQEMLRYGLSESHIPGHDRCHVTEFRNNTSFDLTCTMRGATVGSLNVTSTDLLDWDSWDPPSGTGVEVDVWSMRAPVNILGPTQVRKYGSTKTKTRAQTLKIKQGKKPAKPAKCATYAKFKKVKNGMTVNEVKTLLGPSKVQFSSGGYVNREYKPCKKYDYYVVLFEDGYVWDKMYSGF